MKFKILALLITLGAMWLIIGCSGNNAVPTLPYLDQASGSGLTPSHQLWGVWQFRADPEMQTLDAIQLREADMHLNALVFLEPPAFALLTIESLEFDGDQVTADIGLRHPFLGVVEFTGFDVCGIFITSGNVTGFDDADIRMTGNGDTRLINPDGYTRWWNPAEFPVNEGTIFSYNDGLLGAPHATGNFNCTLNAYKYFTDGLEPNDGLDTVDPSARGIFSAGQKNVRRYIIQMDAGLVFNYAVDANWKFPVGSQPWEAPDDFDESANRPEAWNIGIAETANTLWNDGSTSGGGLILSIDVYDHFNPDMNTLKVESPGNFAMVMSDTAIGGGAGYSTYEVEITDATPAQDSISLLITVECERSGYGGLLLGSQQAAYFTYTADVSSEQPCEGIFVDGDNEGDPDEDGSMAHPFDTIQEGIDAAGIAPFEDIYDIYVDPYAGGDYALFATADDVQVHGNAWAGGTGKPELILTGSWTMANNVNNCLLEDFLITLNHTAQVSGEVHLINIIDSGDFTIKDCKFTGQMASQFLNILYYEHSDGFKLEHNEFVNIRNKSLYTGGGHGIYMIKFQNCDDGTIIQNEMHDIGYDDEGASTSSQWTTIYLMLFYRDGGDHCENIQVLNNLIYDINDCSKTSGGAKNHMHLFGWSAIVGTPALPNFVWANNTVDDISVIGDDPSVSGQASLCWGGAIDNSWTMKNSIISNLAPITQVPAVNWHRGFWADSSIDHVPVTYSCCYNFGTPGPGVTVGDYVNFFTKGTGSFGLSDNQDPAYDMTPGDNFYHVANSLLLSDPADGGEMGAFGGPYGDWLPPSQE